MKRFSFKYQLLVLTVFAVGVWGVAVDLPFTFKAGDVISAEQMNQTLAALNGGKQERVSGECAAGSAIRRIDANGSVACEVDDIGAGGDAGVDAINGMSGAVTLQAGDNVSIDDSTPGQIVISATDGGGSNSNEHSHFGQTWTGEGDSGLTVVNTRTDTAGTSVILGRSGAGSNIDRGPDIAGVWGDGERGAGVWGTNVQGPGVFGVSQDNAGVYGFSPEYRGVYGESESGSGVYGGSESGTGVLGNSSSGRGTSGLSSSGIGTYGESQAGIGVWGKSGQTRGVVGTVGDLSCAGTYGVGGCTATGQGVYGRTSASGQSGVRGETEGTTVGYGVSGFSASGIGVYGESTNNAGVFGRSTNNNAAFFTGGSGGGGSCYFNGGAGWNCTSDERAKENFQPVDTSYVLEHLATMPITTWTMKGDLNATPHLGPTAQDFYAAFALGDSDTTINSADAQGVALAAIQGLYELVQEQQEQIAALEAKLSGLE